jgi:peptide-methionine (S)-S-oxide reductase
MRNCFKAGRSRSGGATSMTPRSIFQRLSSFALPLGGLALIALVLAPALQSRASSDPIVLPPPAVDAQPADGLQTAILAGGCFWGVQAVYQHTDGVISAVSGYSGGTKETANYDLVSAGRSRHAEAVEIKFDPKKISYGKILQIFFSVVHDPTQLDRQGPDVGPQYRSAIFVQNDEQKRVAEAYIAQLGKEKLFKKPIVTKVDRLEAFYPAETYHQDYATLNPNNMYIVINDAPKIGALARLFPNIYRQKPLLVSAARKQ